MEVDTSIYRSPKRKRGPIPSLAPVPPRGPHPSLITSGLSQCLSPSNTSEQADDTTSVGSHSPSMRVTGKFQKLDLRSPIDLPSPVISHDSLPKLPQPDAEQTVISNHEPSPPNSQDFKPPEADFVFESPLTRTPSDTSMNDRTDTTTTIITTTTTTTTSSPNTPPASEPAPAPAPQMHLPTTLTPPPTSTRTKSPPPSTLHSNQFWQANEITGWTPNDPDEDYYGVNGVGYAKPPAKAWAISQKRKQQIAEYRSRETREARQRRHERRLSGFNAGSRRGSASSLGVGKGEGKEKKGVRFVHFEDG